MTSTNNKSIFSIDDTNKIKGIAILLMIFHHSFMAGRYPEASINFYPLSEHITNVIALQCKICVAIFTFLSAYGITLSYNSRNTLDKNEIRKQIIRRYVKLITGFMFILLCLNIYSIIFGKSWFTHIYGKTIIAPFYAIIDFFGLAQFFHTPTFIATFWYISLAIVIIFIMPLLILFYRKFGGLLLVFVSMLFSILFPVYTSTASEQKTFCFLSTYSVCISLGIICADKNLIVKIKEVFNKSKYKILLNSLKAIFLFAVILYLIYIRYKTGYTDFLPTLDSVITLLTIAFLYEFINPIPVIGHILKFLGIHSMNIFLIHNFIRVAWYYDFTYSFKSVWAIFAVLLLISLAISVILEFTKKLLNFSKLQDKIIKQL